MSRRISPHRPSGFTLVEIVVSIAITAIVIGFVAMFMTAPVDAYIAQSERSELNDTAQLVSRSLENDLRTALPNSVRIRNAGTRSIVEFLQVRSMSFYRATDELGGVAARELDFSPIAETSFSAFGNLQPQPGDHLVIRNLGMGNGNNAWDAYRLAGSQVITPNGTNIQVAGAPPSEQTVTILPSFRFAQSDSHNRIFLVSGPVSYICNSAANARSLRRYNGYLITAGIPTSENSAQLLAGASTLLATNVSSCQLRCTGGNNNACNDLLVVNIVVNRNVPGGTETIKIFEQFRMDTSS